MKYDSYLSIFLTFVRFGLLAWGGPVAQIAVIRDDLVERRQWIIAALKQLPMDEATKLGDKYLGKWMAWPKVSSFRAILSIKAARRFFASVAKVDTWSYSK